MNPFAKQNGVHINGEFYTKANLESLNITASANGENEAAALEFSKTLLSGIETIKVKTSGSTGNPKEFEFTKEAIAISASATNRFFNLMKKSIAVLPLPMKYIAGKMMVARAILGGYDLIVLEATSNPDLRSLQADFMPVTPFQMHNLIENQKGNLGNVKTFLIGGGQPTKRLIAAVKDSGTNAFASFGMTETLSHFALADLSKAIKFPLYNPVKGVEIKTDTDDKLLVNWPKITDGWLNTNDLVQLDKNAFRWLGRADNLINSGGVKVIPERVENILQGHILADFFVAGVKHDTLGEEVVVFTESKTELNLDDFNWDFKHQQPRRIIVINSFLRTVSGKIRRRATIEKWLEAKTK